MSAAVTAPATAAPATRSGGAKRVLPGFGLTLGYTLFYLSIIVLIPLATLLFKTFELTWAQFWKVVTDPIAVSAYKVTFGASAIAAGLAPSYLAAAAPSAPPELSGGQPGH